MKNPYDVIEGEIVSDECGELIIKAHYDDWCTLTKRGYKKVSIYLKDSRKLSDKQRKACYALMREISDYSGMSTDSVKEYMKLKFLSDNFEETGGDMFSLSDAPMSLICAFQRFLVRFIVEQDIPCRFPLLDFVDDIPDYVYSCLINKKCAVCGKVADLHYVEHVGIGRDRDEIIHEGMEVLPLCRIHHNECHAKGQKTFNELYHFDKGIKLDKTLCRIYGLRRKRNE